jgi:CxxC-x17-CxxC domain-containing protein
MNKFKKPRSNSSSGSRINSRPSSRPGGRPSFGAPTRPRFGGGGSARGRDDVPQKFDAVCSKCGKACQVPFRPNGKRPVYCNDCFGAPQQSSLGKSSFGADASSNGGGEGGGKSIADLTRQIAAMNAKIDTMLEILQGDES